MMPVPMMMELGTRMAVDNVVAATKQANPLLGAFLAVWFQTSEPSPSPSSSHEDNDE